jgi:hypothetical protein
MSLKTKTSGIPPVPFKVDRELRQFLEGVRENLEVNAGRRGKPIDRAVTFRDLQNGALADVKISSGGTVSVAPPSGGGGGGDPVETPTSPTSLQAVAGFDFVLLQWDIPSYAGHSIAEIYRQTVDSNDANQVISVGNSVLVGTTSSFLFRDTVPGRTAHYYWVRFVNTEGTPGPYHSTDGIYAETAANYDDLIDESVVDILAGLAIWQNDVVTSLDILNDNVIQSTLNNATSITSVGDSISAAEGRLNSSITTTQTVAANATAAVAVKTENLQSTIFNTNPDGSIQLDGAGAPIFSGAFIEKVDATLATIDGELSAAIGNTVSLLDEDGNAYSLSDILSLALDAEGNLTAQWGIKFSKDDLLYGVGLVSVNDKVTFTVASDSFAIYNPANGTEVIPFVVNEAGQVLISQAFIDYAAITDLVSENIVASQIAVGVSITSPIIYGGEIIGGSLNINNNTRIESNGLLTTINAFIQGHIDADSGTLNNVVIAETCTVNGTINAANIEGDVIDRSVLVINDEVTVGANSYYVLIEGVIVPGFIGGTNERTLVVSGISLDHQGGGGSTSNFDVVLYVDGNEVQRFSSHNVEEEGSVTPCLGAIIPAGATDKTFRVTLETSTNDNILVQQSAIVADVFKKGSTITQLNGMFSAASSTPIGGGGNDPGVGDPPIYLF